MRHEIQQRTEKRISQAIEDNGRFEIDEIAQLESELTGEVVNEYHSRAKEASLVEGTPENFEKTMRRTLGNYLKTTRESKFRSGPKTSVGPHQGPSSAFALSVFHRERRS